MTRGITFHLLQLVTAFAINFVDAIRVDFNTNTGPIVPPTSTPQPVPQPPFRNPAPVWEDQSNDIPNPTPYNYILPPPSRPRNNQYQQSNSNEIQNQRRLDTFHQPVQLARPVQVFSSKVISKPLNAPQEGEHQHKTYNVPSLSVSYVPNIGWRYYAVVQAPVDDKFQHIVSNRVNEYHNNAINFKKNYDTEDKYKTPNDRHQAKLRKYKNYEMLKQKEVHPLPDDRYNDIIAWKAKLGNPQYERHHYQYHQQNLLPASSHQLNQPVQQTTLSSKVLPTVFNVIDH